MLPNAVATVQVYVESAEHPNLDNSQRAKNISKKRSAGGESVLDVMHQGVVPADYVNENQVIDQLNIFNSFFFFAE